MNNALALYNQLFLSRVYIETGGITNPPDGLEGDREKLAKCWAGLFTLAE